MVANACATYVNCRQRLGGRAHQYQPRGDDNHTCLFAESLQLRASRDVHGYGDGAQGFYKGTPTGTVSFYDGTTNIGNSNLNSSGVATLTTSTLSVGTHNMTATYNGDTNFAPSTSPVLYQVVQGAIASLSPTSLNFGNQTVGITSTPRNVMLTNTGNINLTITSIQITGTNSGDFAQTNNCPGSRSTKRQLPNQRDLHAHRYRNPKCGRKHHRQCSRQPAVGST